MTKVSHNTSPRIGPSAVKAALLALEDLLNVAPTLSYLCCLSQVFPFYLFSFPGLNSDFVDEQFEIFQYR